jgi:uncharacterized membrane protein YsdA (DUF1294 family)
MVEWFLKLGIFAQIAIIYFTTINIVTFFSFGLDKSRACSHERRTPEKKLWLLTLLGGSPAALFAMRYFRHKTKKMSFQAMVIIIICFQIAMIFTLYNLWEIKNNPILY